MKRIFEFTFIFVSILYLQSCNEEVAPEEESSEIENTEILVEKIIADSSNITCPFCDFTTKEELPTDYCIISYECKNCEETIHPKVGDCCVFCTWGDEKCPSIQESELN